LRSEGARHVRNDTLHRLHHEPTVSGRDDDDDHGHIFNDDHDDYWQ